MKSKVFVGLIVVAVLYFSWIPSPNLVDTGLFPEKVGEWIDEHYNSRTAIPFILIGVCYRFLLKNQSFSRALNIITSISFLLVMLAEIGQIFLPERHFDLEDVAWGVFGGVLGLVGTHLLVKLLGKF